eukprot:163676-Ditylum_brightwellii.AAC.1
MLSNSTKKPFVAPTPGSTKASTPDSSKNFAKSTSKNKNNTPALLRTVITPQNDKENTKQAEINSTTINKPLRLPSTLHRMIPIASQRSNLTTTGAMIASNINSEFSLSQDEHTQVSASDKINSKESSNQPLTTPTSKHMASTVRNELHLMMSKMQEDLNQDIQDIQDMQQR